MKQSKLRRRRVFRFAVLYFFLFIVFMGLMIAPVFVGNMATDSLVDSVREIGGLMLYQPNGQKNDQTDGEQPTGIGSVGYKGKFTSTAASSPRVTADPDSGAADPETADP